MQLVTKSKFSQAIQHLQYVCNGDQSWVHQTVQSQKKARSLKFWIGEDERLYYPSSENKHTDQLCSAQLICIFVFAYADCWFSGVAAHFRVLSLM